MLKYGFVWPVLQSNAFILERVPVNLGTNHRWCSATSLWCASIFCNTFAKRTLATCLCNSPVTPLILKNMRGMPKNIVRVQYFYCLFYFQMLSQAVKGIYRRYGMQSCCIYVFIYDQLLMRTKSNL